MHDFPSLRPHTGDAMLGDIMVGGMSRSGTTLLVTILDSHPGVSMGYELLPAALGDLHTCADRLEDAARQDPSYKSVAERLKSENYPTLAGFVKRAHRTLVEPPELASIIRKVASEGVEPDSFEARILLSREVVHAKRRLEGASRAGYKLNAPSIRAFDDVSRTRDAAPAYVFITRDPRDVVASHRVNGFDRSTAQICDAWTNYLAKFLDFKDAYSDRTCVLIRYEDLACEPDTTISELLDALDLPPDGAPRRFYESKASVHERGHRNRERLKRDIDTNAVCRWTSELDMSTVAEIQGLCAELMQRVGYQPAGFDRPPATPERTVAGKLTSSRLKGKKRYFRDQYAELILPLARGRVNLTWAEACRRERHAAREVLILRHDVDHDLDTAVRMAQWEHERGLRATYCILHTAWYYGSFKDGVHRRSPAMLERVKCIAEMGHEINLHNNFVVFALTHGTDPAKMLLDELAYFRMHGVEIEGTSTHGDALCRELDFRNFELFKGRAYPTRGGARTVEHEGNSVRVGELDPARFALTYEAYDLPRDLYLSDSGGSIRIRRNTRGLAGLRRKQMDDPPPYTNIVGILTHPVWWDMEHDAPSGPTVHELEDLREGDVLDPHPVATLP